MFNRNCISNEKMKIYQLWQKMCIIFIIVWVFILWMTIKPKKKPENITEKNVNKKLNNILIELDDLYQKNTELKQQVITSIKRYIILYVLHLFHACRLSKVITYNFIVCTKIFYIFRLRSYEKNVSIIHCTVFLLTKNFHIILIC